MENQMPLSPNREERINREATSNTRLLPKEMEKAKTGRSTAVKKAAKMTLKPSTRTEEDYIRRAEME